MRNWFGKKHSMTKPFKFVTTEAFYFGGKLIPKGVEVRQWENRDFGYCLWRNPENNRMVWSKE